jgi:hypothetical protein
VRVVPLPQQLRRMMNTRLNETRKEIADGQIMIGRISPIELVGTLLLRAAMWKRRDVLSLSEAS